jgi:predicted CoA-binding protein
MQEGIRSPEAVQMLKKMNINVIWNRCMMKEHNRLFGSKPLIPLGKK